MSLFVNAQLVAELNLASIDSIGHSESEVYFGYADPGASMPYGQARMILDDLALYSKRLDASQIAEHYNNADAPPYSAPTPTPAPTSTPIPTPTPIGCPPLPSESINATCINGVWVSDDSIVLDSGTLCPTSPDVHVCRCSPSPPCQMNCVQLSSLRVKADSERTTIQR